MPNHEILFFQHCCWHTEVKLNMAQDFGSNDFAELSIHYPNFSEDFSDSLAHVTASPVNKEFCFFLYKLDLTHRPARHIQADIEQRYQWEPLFPC